MLSISVCPILIYLAYRLVGNWLVWLILSAFLAGFVWLILAEWAHRDARKQANGAGKTNRYQFWALLMGAGWGGVLHLMPGRYSIGKQVILFGRKLRLHNPSCFDRCDHSHGCAANQSQLLSRAAGIADFLYILVYPRQLDRSIGGKMGRQQDSPVRERVLVRLRMMATIAFYLRLRNQRGGSQAWRTAFMGWISAGQRADFIPVVFYMTLARIQLGVIG